MFLVSQYQNGNLDNTFPEINKLIILSDLFNITLDDLVKDKNIDIYTDVVDDQIKKIKKKIEIIL